MNAVVVAVATPGKGKNSLEQMRGVERARKPARLPVVLARAKVHKVFAHLHGNARLMAALLYGGLRLMECIRLRVKDMTSPPPAS